MRISVESIGKLERRMQVQVPAARVVQAIATRLQHLSRTARLNGFRPGKAPLKVIRQQFGPQVHREVIGELLQTSFREALQQQQLAPAGNPHIEPQSVDEGQDLTYIATFEVYPDLALQAIDSLDIERITAEVSAGDVDAMIERLRKQQMKFSAVSRAAANGDKLTVDFDGTIDGVTFVGGKGENIAILLGENRMLAQLEQGLIGACQNERREVRVDFPADYRATEIAGKTASFSVEVKSVEEPSLPELDEEFCKSFGVGEGGVAKLREEAGANMRRELEQNLRNRNKNEVMEKLLRAHPFDVPNALLETQIRDMQIEAMRRSGTKEVSQAPPREPLVEPARRRVALGLLFSHIIQRENLVADPARANARLDEIVGAFGEAGALKSAYMQNPAAMRQVQGLALEDQVVDWILAHAKVRERTASFKEVMNFEA